MAMYTAAAATAATDKPFRSSLLPEESASVVTAGVVCAGVLSSAVVGVESAPVSVETRASLVAVGL